MTDNVFRNLVGTYWKHHGENTVYKVIKLYNRPGFTDTYCIQWLMDELFKHSPGQSRSQVVAAPRIITDIQITEDEYLLMLIK